MFVKITGLLGGKRAVKRAWAPFVWLSLGHAVLF